MASDRGHAARRARAARSIHRCGRFPVRACHSRTGFGTDRSGGVCMTITVTLAGERFERGLSLVASLPRTLRLSQDPIKAPADLVLVDGRAEWTARTAVAI